MPTANIQNFKFKEVTGIEKISNSNSNSNCRVTNWYKFVKTG